uniref:Uncharacterized protein n=1 Tax=Cacopsylla melanoneura TaxID=428564 RepID=A0A8D8ZDQ4_9HEMI
MGSRHSAIRVRWSTTTVYEDLSTKSVMTGSASPCTQDGSGAELSLNSLISLMFPKLRLTSVVPSLMSEFHQSLGPSLSLKSDPSLSSLLTLSPLGFYLRLLGVELGPNWVFGTELSLLSLWLV